MAARGGSTRRRIRDRDLALRLRATSGRQGHRWVPISRRVDAANHRDDDRVACDWRRSVARRSEDRSRRPFASADGSGHCIAGHLLGIRRGLGNHRIRLQREPRGTAPLAMGGSVGCVGSLLTALVDRCDRAKGGYSIASRARDSRARSRTLGWVGRATSWLRHCEALAADEPTDSGDRSRSAGSLGSGGREHPRGSSSSARSRTKS